MKKTLQIVPVEIIENKIHVIRGMKVMLDFDLAKLYMVPTKSLNLAVRRNKSRFPADFMFQLNKKEYDNLRFQFETSSLTSQFAMSKQGSGGRRYLPYAFTEQGVAMLSSVLKSKRAVETSILVVRAFIKLREMLQSHKDILSEIEKIKRDQSKHGEKISAIMNVINKLLAPTQKPVAEPKKEQIGFRAK